MRLQLQHLAPYLPYGIKFQSSMDKPFEEMGNQATWTLDGVNKLFGDYCLLTKENNDAYEITSCKPILHPLSDLIENILEDGNDENYNLSCELSELLNTNDCSHFVKALIEKKYYAVDVRLWNDIEDWLYKNHFDWKYNLIQQNLAIDINTL